MNTTLEYCTRVVQEGDRRCKRSTLNDLAYLTPLRIPLMNPVKFTCEELNAHKPLGTDFFAIERTHMNIVMICYFTGSLTQDFRLQFFFINQCPSGPWVYPIGPFWIFSNIRWDIREWMFIVGKNFEIKFFKIFSWELSLVPFTPKDWIFAYF